MIIIMNNETVTAMSYWLY